MTEHGYGAKAGDLVIFSTISHYARSARWEAVRLMYGNHTWDDRRDLWKRLRKEGWTCVKIEVSEI